MNDGCGRVIDMNFVMNESSNCRLAVISDTIVLVF